MKKLSNSKSMQSIIINLCHSVITVILVLTMFSCDNGSPRAKVMLQRMELCDMVSDKDIPQNSIKADSIFNTEEYNRIYENPFKDAVQNPLSTFSIDVDKASYSNIRRYLDDNQLPPKDAVRIEEMINYFSYHYLQPIGEHPFSIYTETAVCPWNNEHLLLHIGLQGKKIDYEHMKSSNLVFLIDVSGSMEDSNKLPLVKKSLLLMLDNLQRTDKVAMVVYAGSAGIVLPSTSVDNKDDIKAAIKNLYAGGSTAGGEGLQLAYNIAKENYLSDGNNRVILCTDGDFNVGPSSTSDMVRLIEEKRKENIYLTICGFGMGNYKDGRLEQISSAGNGNYFYIDQFSEAEKVFARELRANMFTIAKDVKIQIEFNPSKVKAYRLIGYENRVLDSEDFNNDLKDAGELGAGHTVTALYEVILSGSEDHVNKIDPLKYQKTVASGKIQTNEMATIKFRYKPIDSETSKLIVKTVNTENQSFASASADFRFAASVAGFGMLLRQSEFKGDASYSSIISMAEKATLGNDDQDKKDFLAMLEKANSFSSK